MSSPKPSTHRGGFEERLYRKRVRSHLGFERVAVQETDLGVFSAISVAGQARDAVIVQRGYLEGYIHRNPQFLHTRTPWPDDPWAPPIVGEMIRAARRAGVGPMAAVAGAVAQRVGEQLRQWTPEVIVENGGDIFFDLQRPLTVALLAGASPLSMKIGLRLDPATGIRAVCTSSGTVGHSLSLGRADAACVVSDSCALADAVATSMGNRVSGPGMIQAAIEWAKGIQGVRGVLVVLGNRMGAWGEIETVPV